VVKISKLGPYTASYIVYKGDDGKTYVKNGKTGQIEYSSGDDADTIQYALNQASAAGGGRIFIRSGMYIITKPIKLVPRIVVEGEAPFLLRDIDGYAPPTAGAPVVLRASDTSIKQVFYWYDDTYSADSIVIKDLYVEGAGLLKLGSEGEKWGGSGISIKRVHCNFYALYPNGTDIYCLDIWHSLHVYAEQVYGSGGPVLRFATDFVNKMWNFGNSVFVELFSNVPRNVPNIHVYSGGDPNKTGIGLLVFIRPQTLGGGFGLWLNGESSPIRDVTIIAANLENTPGVVLRGLVSKVFVQAHYPWLVRLCKNSAGKTPEIPRNMGDIRFELDGGKIKVYESDCKTDGGARAYPPMGLEQFGEPVPLLSYYRYPQFFAPNWAYNVNLTKTSQSGSGVYGADNNPIMVPIIHAVVPAGTTLNPGVNRFYVYTRWARDSAAPPLPLVFKYSGWDQADLDVQARLVTFNSTYSCWQIAVDVINRTGSSITLSSNLAMIIVTYAFITGW